MALGASLTGCGSGGETGFAPGDIDPGLTPLAYNYVPIIKSGDSLPGGLKVSERGLNFSLSSSADSPPPFMGAVVITDSRHIYFHGVDQTESRGIYRIDVDDSGNRSDARKVVREGDLLPDGTRVDDFSDGDVNNGDDFVIGVQDPDGVNSIQYSAGGRDFASVLKSGSGVADVQLAEDITQCQAISDDGNILFVADYLNSDGDAEGEGLFTVPTGTPQQARLVLANQGLLPGTSCAVQTIGTTEICSGGFYVVQGSAAPAVGGSSADASGRPLTFLLNGQLGRSASLLAVDPALAPGGGGVTSGSVVMCPRLNPATRQVGFIVQIDENRSQLRVNGTAVIGGDLSGARGSTSPRGATVLSVLPPVFGPRRQVFFQVFTTAGMELCVWNGSRTITVLGTGDNVNGKVVNTILFGCLPEAVNTRGEFVAIVEFTDGETDIFLGSPL